MPPRQFQEHNIARANASLYVRESGKGSPVIFIHGGLADHRGALFHAGSLAPHYRLITPDLRCAGRSHSSATPSWEQHSDDLAAILDHLELDSVILGGNSAGTGAVIHFACRFPSRCRGLVLLDPVYPGARHPMDPATQSAMLRIGQLGEDAQKGGIDAILPYYDHLPEPIRTGALDMVRSFHPPSVSATARHLASMIQPFDDLSDLAKLNSPILVRPGSDPEHPASLAEEYIRRIPNAKKLDATTSLSEAVLQCWQNDDFSSSTK